MNNCLQHMVKECFANDADKNKECIVREEYMRHAMLITAYKDMNLLYELCKIYCDKFDFDCFIHIDKRTKVKKEVVNKLRSIGNVVVVQKYKVKWGSYYHPMAFVYLLQLAQTEQYDFYHCISANTFVGKNKKQFYDFFEEHKNNNFVEIISFKGNESEAAISEWYKYYHYPFLYDKRGKCKRVG
ncbi:MAG: hypothetical protein K2I01_07765, partial [Lachnospiraceae bacterium]|nr:hypothetical protein [Lachnospiraceae bacterium]